MGSFLAIHDGNYNWLIIGLAALTTTLLQILSNMANDYGDSQKGTDNINRLGPLRTVQSGEISPSQMKKGIWIVSLLSLLSGILLLYVSFKNDFFVALLFLFIGLAAIAAAIKYTVGKGAYGYAGFGDLFVFIFFGLVGVFGSYYLNTQNFRLDVLLPAVSIGLLSTGVLNLNNLRDFENDIQSGKHTLAARLGFWKAKIYQALLLFGALISATVYAWLNYTSPWNFIFLLAFPLIFRNLNLIFNQKKPALLDPFLKKLALETFFFTVIFGVGMLV
jgi:1,4-dihydroxy-2-naphthoate octaprenyltransferase